VLVPKQLVAGLEPRLLLWPRQETWVDTEVRRTMENLFSSERVYKFTGRAWARTLALNGLARVDEGRASSGLLLLSHA